MRQFLLHSLYVLIIFLGMPAGSFATPTDHPISHDASKPLHVAADNLVVLQENGRAVFTGNVIATQGAMELKSDKMVVSYRDTKNRPSGENAISRVDVSGNVILTTEKEKATGNQGYYDVDGSLVKLTGDVVLSQGETVIKGQDLVYNVKTRQSSIKASRSEIPGKKGANGRVEMYIPNVQSLDKNKKKQ